MPSMSPALLKSRTSPVKVTIAPVLPQACYLMDMLKQSVPLWKKEFKGDKSEWVAAKASDDKAALKWMRKK